MKRNEFSISIILLFCGVIISCSEKSTNPPPPPDELNDITSPPSSWINVLAVNSNDIFFAGTAHKMFRSTNYGNTWEKLTLPVSLLNDVYDIFITSNNLIISGYERDSDPLQSGGIVISSDNGNTWKRSSPSPSGFPIISVKEKPNGDIYACGYGLHKSIDNGNSWEEIYQGYVYDFCISNDSIIVIGIPGTFTGHLMYSPNNGSTWQTTSYNVTVLEFYKYGSIIFVGGMRGIEGGGGLHKSTDAGINWEFCGLGYGTITSFVTNKLSQLFVGTDEGIYFTNDSGTTWQIVLADSIITTLMRDSKDYLYAGTNKGTFLRSTDNGMSWHN